MFRPNYRAGRGVSAPPALDWWRGFRSAELTRLIEEAQTANLDIAAAIGRIMQADAQAKIAGAPLLPGVDFAGSATRLRPPGGPMRDDYRVALNAAYEIDFWGKNRAASRAAQETAVATRFDKEVIVISHDRQRRRPPISRCSSSQDRLRIARNNLDAANRVLTLIKQRLEAGTTSQLEVAQQESLVATVRAVIPLFDQTLRQNIAVLAVLVGRAPADFSVKGGSIYRLGIPRVTPGLPSELLLQRPDIRAAEANLASAGASVESARAAFFPSISLTGQGGYESEVLKLLFTPQTAFYNIAVNVAQPLLDGFRLEGQLELAQGRQFELLKVYCQIDPRRLRRRGDRAHRGRRHRRARALAAGRRQHRATGLPARRKQAARRHRRSTSPCCRPSRPCSRPRTICRSRVSHVCRRC